eukprot:8403416-Pyramimonas_sp.AAC.1
MGFLSFGAGSGAHRAGSRWPLDPHGWGLQRRVRNHRDCTRQYSVASVLLLYPVVIGPRSWQPIQLCPFSPYSNCCCHSYSYCFCTVPVLFLYLRLPNLEQLLLVGIGTQLRPPL